MGVFPAQQLGMRYQFFEISRGDHIDVIAGNPQNIRRIFDFFDQTRRDDLAGRHSKRLSAMKTRRRRVFRGGDQPYVPIRVFLSRGSRLRRAIRRGLRTRHIVPVLALRRTAHGSGLGRWRWVVERTFAWLNQFRRLRVRYDKRADIHEAFLSLGCALICWQSLRKTWMTG
jgi:transposase